MVVCPWGGVGTAEPGNGTLGKWKTLVVDVGARGTTESFALREGLRRWLLWWPAGVVSASGVGGSKTTMLERRMVSGVFCGWYCGIVLVWMVRWGAAASLNGGRGSLARF